MIILRIQSLITGARDCRIQAYHKINSVNTYTSLGHQTRCWMNYNIYLMTCFLSKKIRTAKLDHIEGLVNISILSSLVTTSR